MASFVKPATPCFFMAKIYVKDYNYVAQLIDTFISESINYNAYSALLLLSASRFLALYFPHIYDKFTKGKNIFLTIIIFDIVALLLDICPLFALFSLDRVNKILEECVVRENLSKSMCIAKQEYVKDTWYQVLESLTRIFTIIQYAKTPLFIFLSIISTVMVILKVAKQAKFQLKHNKNDFYNSLRIVVVIALQTLINCFGFFVEAYAKFLPNLIRNYKLNIRITAINNLAGQDYSGYLDLRIADWFDGENGLASTFPRQMILQFRILIESFIVLAIMTGYRESLIDFMKFNYKFMCHPLKTFKRLKSNRNMTKISEINVF
uniref:Gustatory receptor n=1 Tax=Panagrolaimus davidi TaxID=227884 RepID=A0A914QBF1_9BILA